MSQDFARSAGQIFIRSDCQARRRPFPTTNFACAVAYWPYNGFSTYITATSGPPTFMDSWPLLYSTLTETWNIPSLTPTSYTQVSVYNNYFQPPLTTQFTGSITVTGTRPSTSGLDLTSISVSSGGTGYSSSGVDGSYTAVLSLKLSFFTNVQSCLALLATLSIPAFQPATTQDTTHSPFKTAGETTAGIIPVLGGSAAVVNPCWVGAAASGLAIRNTSATTKPKHIFDFNYVLNNSSALAFNASNASVNSLPSVSLIVCAKSKWRLNNSVPPPPGTWTDPNTGLPASLFTGSAFIHNQLYSHLFDVDSTSTFYTDLGVTSVRSLPQFIEYDFEPAQIIGSGTYPSGITGIGEIGFTNTLSVF